MAYEFEYPQLSSLNRASIQERSIRKQWPSFYAHLMTSYDDAESFSERLYRFYNNIDVRPVCSVCCGPVRFISISEGFRRCCSAACANRDSSVKQHKRESCQERYGVDNAAQSDDVKEKAKRTCLERYGADISLKNDEIKHKAEITCQDRYGYTHPSHNDSVRTHISTSVKQSQDKIKQTCRDRYGVDTVFESDMFKHKRTQSLMRHYGVSSPMQSDDVKNKVLETKRNNHTFNSSRTEDRTAAWLDSDNIKYIRQYKSDLYPYCCDFYLPDYDLYVEIQGSWTHGSHPYNADSEEDTNQLLEWTAKKNKYYDNAIDTWTHRDVAKRQCAIRNNINYLEIFSSDIDEIKQKISNAIS